MFTTSYSYEDRGKDSERPVRLDKTEGHVIIEGRTYPAKEIVEALAQSGYVEMRAVGDSLVLGRKRITPIFKSRQERAMAALCHGSLAYCCPQSKRCAERDRALEMLGLTSRDYESLKGDAHHRFIDTARGIPSEDTFGSAYLGNQANQPARDPGYGSDDYRRDFDTLDQALQSSDRRESYLPRTHQRSEEKGTRLIPDTQQSTKGSTCALRDDSIEGIASLFQQGELSPFSDSRPDDRPSFCFSCGRTINRGTEICSYCGARQ